MAKFKVGDRVTCIRIGYGGYICRPFVNREYVVIRDVLKSDNNWVWLRDTVTGYEDKWVMTDFELARELTGLEKEIRDIETMGYRQ